jgi:hypothetical protein
MVNLKTIAWERRPIYKNETKLKWKLRCQSKHIATSKIHRYYDSLNIN